MRLDDHVQSEEGDSPAADTAVGSKISAAFETCLKIRGLGVDTAGTLDALCSVLSAASGSVGGGTPRERAVEVTQVEKDAPDTSEAVAISNRLAEAVEQSLSTAASSAPPALWSLEFAYSELERVLEALETAVSGLIFVVGATADVEAQPESSALWYVCIFVPYSRVGEETVVVQGSVNLTLFRPCAVLIAAPQFSDLGCMKIVKKLSDNPI